jgi:hypothetical protein
MKHPLLFTLMATVALSACGQPKQQFDIIAYKEPSGWKKEQKAETLTFTKEKGADFCMITVYKSIDATNDPEQNFSMSWQALMQQNLGTGAATMQPGSSDKGWETRIGSAPFEKENIKGAAILISSTNNSKLVNIICVTNTEAYQQEMESLLESIDLKSHAAGAVPTAATSTTISTPRHEVWMNENYSILKKRYERAWFVKYANGDCLSHLPGEGLLGISKTNDQAGRKWGVVRDKGREIHLDYGDAVLKLGKQTATKMSYPSGSASNFYYKCVPVDGLKLDGEWSSGGSFGDPNWYKNPNYKDGTIRFYKDGKFENKEGLYCNNPGSGYRTTGTGSYEIKDFTLVLTYSDGVKFTLSLTGFRDISPQKDNAILYMRGVAYYKRLAK